MKHVKISLAAFLMMLVLGFVLAGQAEAKGSVPAAENLELTTKRALPLIGRLSAHDADGDLTAFRITTPPRKGSITLGDDGSFVYMPRPGKTGRDYFGYRAVDAEGNVSQEATALIRIEKE